MSKYTGWDDSVGYNLINCANTVTDNYNKSSDEFVRAINGAVDLLNSDTYVYKSIRKEILECKVNLEGVS